MSGLRPIYAVCRGRWGAFIDWAQWRFCQAHDVPFRSHHATTRTDTEARVIPHIPDDDTNHLELLHEETTERGMRVAVYLELGKTRLRIRAKDARGQWYDRASYGGAAGDPMDMQAAVMRAHRDIWEAA